MSVLIDKLKAIVGEGGYREGADVNPRSYGGLLGGEVPAEHFVLRPKSTEEVSQILRLCHEAGQPVVPQGGMTGLVRAGQARPGEIGLSLERMTKIEELDRETGTLTVEAGCPLEAIHDHAGAAGFLFPLDLGARGSCTIGGNLSTNAGGNRVIRYGMTRALALGLEAVLADGTVINSLYKLQKNNSGYDLKQLFIGTEGTLGIITRAVLKLLPKPKTQSVALSSLQDFESVSRFLAHMQESLAGTLSAFEVLWGNMYDLIVEKVDHVRGPLPVGAPFYVLTESFGSHPDRDQEAFEAALGAALEAGLIKDAVIAKSDAEIGEIWAVRDGVTETGPRYVGGEICPPVAFDVSLAIPDMDRFAREVTRRVAEHWEHGDTYVFGHLGDGNLHVIVFIGPDGQKPAERAAVDELVYALVGEVKGSISAEHGIGFLKRPYLKYSRTPEEIALMKRLKLALDPKGILSPGRVFEIEAELKAAAE